MFEEMCSMCGPMPRKYDALFYDAVTVSGKHNCRSSQSRSQNRFCREVHAKMKLIPVPHKNVCADVGKELIMTLIHDSFIEGNVLISLECHVNVERGRDCVYNLECNARNFKRETAPVI